VITELHK